jgi:uncharacterized protein YjbK
MATNIEIEAKVLINEKAYKIVKEHFKNQIQKEYIQTNYYIDNDNLELRAHGASLRIRELEEEYELTLKTPIAEGLLEKTESISKEQYEAMQQKNEFPKTKIQSFLVMLGYTVESFKILACLTTDRTDVKLNEYVFSVDKNTYGKKIDYELEREANNALQAQNDIESICKECGIDFVANKVSKQARALNELKK